MLVSSVEGRRSGLNEREASCGGAEESWKAREGYDSKIACARSCINGVWACCRECGRSPNSDGTCGGKGLSVLVYPSVSIATHNIFRQADIYPISGKFPDIEKKHIDGLCKRLCLVE